MLPLITILGWRVSAQDFWAGVILLLALGGIVTVSYIARTGKVWNVFGVLLGCVLVAALVGIIRG